MAVTKIWRVRGNAGNTIDYANDPEKVIKTYTEEELSDLSDVLEYADDEVKTEKHMFTTGINCTREFAKEEFALTKSQFGKQGGIVAIHGYQSFEEEHITPEEAHEIGVQLARELWGDKFQVIVATHLNTDHVHNHFVINSVSFTDGKRFHMCTDRYLEMRTVSDRLCKEHNLSVIEHPEGKGARYHLYKLERDGMPTRYTVARTAIDKAISRSLNMDEFKSELRSMGYSFRFDPNRKYWTVTVPGWEKPIRIHKLGSEYTKERILERIDSNDDSVRVNKYREAYYRRPNGYNMNKRIHKINTRTGLEKLYLKVCYEMGYLPRYRQDPLKVQYLFRDELLRCDIYGREARLLARYHISTVDDLKRLRASKENDYEAIYSKRDELRKIVKRKIPEEEMVLLNEQITQLTGELKDIRSDLKLIEDIRSRSESLSDKAEQADRIRERKEITR